MNISFSDKLSLLAIIISTATLVFTIVKANSDRKKNIVSKRADVLFQLSSLFLMLDNTRSEIENCLEAELCLRPDRAAELKEQALEEQSQLLKLKDEMRLKYDDISNYSREVDPILQEKLLAHFNSLHKQSETMRNRAKRAKGRIEKSKSCSQEESK